MTSRPFSLQQIDIGPGCWLWVGWKDRHGYGRLKWKGRTTGAHRAVYEALVGPIPPGLVMDHLCRCPPCVRPDHLEPVTPSVNLLRGMSAEGIRERFAAQTHCKNGHPISADTTYWSGQRRCRVCARERARKYRRQGGTMNERGGIVGRFILIIALVFIVFGLLLAWCVDDNDEVNSMGRAPGVEAGR